MHLPPVDKHSRTLVEPLGHLVLSSTRAQHAIIELIALLLPHGPHTVESQVAHKLRRWDGEYVRAAITSAVADDKWCSEALTLVSRLETLREQRHRAMHDTVEHGIFEDQFGEINVGLLHVGFVRDASNKTSLRVVEVTADDIARIAVDFHELVESLKDLWARLQNRE